MADNPGRRAIDSTDKAPPRILAGQLAPAGQQARQAADLGFTHLLLPPPWQPGPAGDPYLTADFSLVASALGGTDLASMCRTVADAGVALLLDVALDAVCASGNLAGTPFQPPEAGLLLDPRRRLRADRAACRLQDREDAEALGAWWAKRLAAWHRAGVAGFRLLGLQDMPGDLLATLFTALRRAVPDAALFVWTPEMPRDAVLALRGLGADGVFASLPWWDGRSAWLWSEIDTLGQTAPVLGLDGVPPGPGHHAPGQAMAPGLAAIIGQGWLHVPLSHQDAAHQDAAELSRLNQAVATHRALAARTAPRLPLGGAGPLLGVLRADTAELRAAGQAVLALVNTDATRTLSLTGAQVLPAAGGAFGAFTGSDGAILDPLGAIGLEPGQTRLFTATARGHQVAASARTTAQSAAAGAARCRLAIEDPQPCVDGGAFPAKAIAGATMDITADVIFDGHDKVAAAIRWRGPGADSWQQAPMRALGNDRWEATMPVEGVGLHHYVVMAWRDRWATFCDELAKKAAAGLRVTLEQQEGEALIRSAATRQAGSGLAAALAALAGLDEAARTAALLAPELGALMVQADDRPALVETAPIPIDAERELAGFASWYEIFPRSMSDDPARHGTFADVERHLPRIAGMGFDVLYFPPIHPIGRKNRKGRNNTLTPSAEDPGSPYAIGSADGGHDALHPELGTLADFTHLREAAAAHGLELAIDFAIQCSPDHPWLVAHRGWFDYRPDGSIRYAENPPKKYEDIVNVDFYTPDAIPGLWTALADVVLFWCEQGIRIFRVDNPHTKPFPFWQWMIAEVRGRFPDAMFLAEAFTRPKVTTRLAKVGFSQNYTYFTWRNTKYELETYLTELNEPVARAVFRPHFFVNTPDINPVFLHDSGRAGFLIRAALAATLSGLWGVYCGFELCEAAAVPGREEYLDSEKYQLRAWDWDRPGNIVAEITALNAMRRANPALHSHLGVRFLPAYNDRILFFEKSTPDRANVVLVAISLDPHNAQSGDIELPLWRWQLADDAALDMDDLVADTTAVWRGKYHPLTLTPDRPYAIWRASPAA